MSLSYENYIKSIDESSGKVLEELKELTFKLVPEAELSISYGIPTFKFKGKNLVHFGAFKDHWSFFPGPFVIEAFKDRLSAYKVSKGTIQVPYSMKVDFDLFRNMILFRVKEING